MSGRSLSRRFWTFSGILALSLLFPACQEAEPPPRHDRRAFVTYYAGEIVLAERARLEGLDSAGAAAARSRLLARHNLTAGSRDTLVAWYRDSLPRWEAFLTEVLRELDERAPRSPSDTGGGIRPAFVPRIPGGAW